MKYAVNITGGPSVRELVVEPGESLEVPLTWQDADGNALDMSDTTITFELYDVTNTRTYGPQSVPDPTLLQVPPSATALWALGAYHAEIWARTYDNGTPPVATRAGAASFLLRVQD